MRKSPLAVFLLLLSFVFTAQAQTNLNQPIPQDPTVRVGKLPNGLTYYIRRNENPAHKVELRLAVNAGSILEREDQRGLAHFMEHMNFNGTEHFKRNELVSYLQSIGVGFGADLNAYTSYDETVYILPIPTEKKELIDKGLLVLHDWASTATLNQADIDKERGIVLEELRLGQGADQRLRDRYFSQVFAGSEYVERLPIGKKEVIEHFDRKSLVDFYETWYRPDLEAVIAVGDLDVNEMEAKIKAQFSGIKAKRKEVERPEFSVPDTKGTLVDIETDPETASTQVLMFYKKPVVKATTQADLRRDLIKRFYSSMLSARLNEIQQSPNSPFLSAGASFLPLFRSKDVYILAGGTDPQQIKATIQALLNESRRVQEFGFTKGELERVKESYLTNLESRYRERNKTPSAAFAGAYVNSFLRREPVTSTDFNYEFGKQIVPTITLEDVNAVAKTTTSDDNRAIIITAQEKAGVKYPTQAEILAALKESATAKLTPYTEKVTHEPLIKGLPTTARVTEERRDDKFGITYWTLSNGVKVVLKPTDFQADEIQMYGFSPGGLSLVDTETLRAGRYFDSVVSESGVKHYSKIELDKMLAGKNARATIGIDESFETVRGGATQKDFETMLQLAYLKFTNLNFDKSIFDSLMNKQKIVLSNITVNPQNYFTEQLFKITGQNHPRAFDPLDTQNLEQARLEAIEAIYKQRFADASGFTFVFVGNFEPEKIKPQIAKYLGNLPSTNRRETWKDWGINPPNGPLEKTFKRGSEDRSTVQIYYTGEAAYDQNENRRLGALGELLTIKLLEQLRAGKSGVYGVSASGGLNKIPSERYQFSIRFSCAPQNAASLIAETTATIARIQKGEIDERDISKVKEARLVKLDETFKNNGYWLSTISNSLKEGRGIMTEEEVRSQINAISKDDLQKAARKYLQSDHRLQFVLMPEAVASNPTQQSPKPN